MSSPLEETAHAIRNAKCVVVSTGAGISAESGIPTFRGDDGIWKKYPPEEYATIYAYRADPVRVWAFWRELGHQMADCKPNPAHFALAHLEAAGHLEAIITQNVDNLHQSAGSRNVIEYHGNAHNLVCTKCGHRVPLDFAALPISPPHCICGAIMKPDVVMFGELIPESAMSRAADLAARADVFLIVGTSAQVFPAADLPTIAKRHGAFIAEFNLESTDFTVEITDAFIQGPAGNTLPALVPLVGVEKP